MCSRSLLVWFHSCKTPIIQTLVGMNFDAVLLYSCLHQICFSVTIVSLAFDIPVVIGLELKVSNLLDSVLPANSTFLIWRLCWFGNNLVDPASSHMLVSKIKPCMSQYKLLHGETANGSLKQLSFIWWSFSTWITVLIVELIHAHSPDARRGVFIRFKTNTFGFLGDS